MTTVPTTSANRFAAMSANINGPVTSSKLADKPTPIVTKTPTYVHPEDIKQPACASHPGTLTKDNVNGDCKFCRMEDEADAKLVAELAARKNANIQKETPTMTTTTTNPMFVQQPQVAPSTNKYNVRGPVMPNMNMDPTHPSGRPVETTRRVYVFVQENDTNAQNRTQRNGGPVLDYTSQVVPVENVERFTALQLESFQLVNKQAYVFDIPTSDNQAQQALFTDIKSKGFTIRGIIGVGNQVVVPFSALIELGKRADLPVLANQDGSPRLDRMNNLQPDVYGFLSSHRAAERARFNNVPSNGNFQRQA